jgi:hypothetical protein
MKTSIYSIRLTDKHKTLLQTSATLNKCSKAKVMEDALNRYYKIKDVLKRT